MTRKVTVPYLMSLSAVLLLLATVAVATFFSHNIAPATASEAETAEAINEGPVDDPRRPTGGITPIVNLQYKVMLWNGEWIATLTGHGDFEERFSQGAVVEVGVPAGTEVFWFGEIGEDNLVVREFAHPWDIRTEDGFDIYRAILTQGTGIQLDLVTTDPRIETQEGPGVRVAYTPLHDVDELWLAAATPPGTAVLDRNIQYLGTGPHGELAFAYVINDVAGGQMQEVDIIYITDATETVSSISPAVPLAIIASVVALAVIGIIYFKKNEVSNIKKSKGIIK